MNNEIIEKRRIKKILNLRSKGYTLDEIGKKLDVTKERIRQIVYIKFSEPELKLFLSYKKKKKLRIKRVTRVCKNCGKKLFVMVTNKQNYCNMDCWKQHKTFKHWGIKVPTNLSKTERIKYLYDNSPKFKKWRIRTTMKYVAKRNADPKKRAINDKKQKIWSRRHYEKLKFGKPKTKLIYDL